jgi:hypothetical protein
MTRRSRRGLAVFCGSTAALLVSARPAAAQRGPAPTPMTLPPEIVSLACAPTMSYELPAVKLRIQEYYTRRPLASSEMPVGRSNPAMIRTTGWIRVWAVDEEMSLATITRACETVDVNDYLEPFIPPVLPPVSANTGEPERGNYASVLSGQDGRTQFGRGDYLLIDRGSNQGVTPGARFVMYHDRKLPGEFLFQIGEAVAVDVKADTSTLHVISAIDAIARGDYAGMRR